MPVDCELISSQSDNHSRSIEDDIQRLIQDLINCPEYKFWDEIDQKRSRQSRYLIRSFLETNFSYKRALQSAKKLFSWKAENKINSLRADSFPKQMHSIDFISLIASDCDGRPTLLVRLCFPSPPKCLLPFVYKYVSWNVEKLIAIVESNNRKPRFVIDCTDARIDLSVIKEVLNILVFIYPPWIESLTFSNMDWKFKVIYSIIRSLVPSFIRDLISVQDASFANRLVSAEDDLPPYLGGSAYNCSYEEWSSCLDKREYFTSRGFSEEQVNECSKYFEDVIAKFGNDGPVKKQESQGKKTNLIQNFD